MQPESAPIAGPRAEATETVLVVDDSRSQRLILASSLKRWGYNVVEAACAAEALALCDNQPIDMVVSDWVMPGMSGLEFCDAFRARRGDRYGYFILLTSKSEKAEIARGLDVGADDFLTKPVNAPELRARIRAGERILRMERQLTEKNRIISQTLDEISGLYDLLDRDLVEARRLQQSLVPERQHQFDGAQVSLLLRPSGRVGGDLVGFYPIDDDRFGFYAIDVSGHGIAAALLTARLAGHFSRNAAGQNLALEPLAKGGFAPRSPAEVAGQLNALMLRDMETDHYFTMLLGHVDLISGSVVMVQCGHPHPVVQRADGSIDAAGPGGLPVGLIADARWDDHCLRLGPGDRMFIASDGVTELPDRQDRLLDDDGLRHILIRNRKISGAAFMETLIWDLSRHAGDEEFPDDVSAILIDFSGREGRTPG